MKGIKMEEKPLKTPEGNAGIPQGKQNPIKASEKDGNSRSGDIKELIWCGISFLLLVLALLAYFRFGGWLGVVFLYGTLAIVVVIWDCIWLKKLQAKKTGIEKAGFLLGTIIPIVFSAGLVGLFYFYDPFGLITGITAMARQLDFLRQADPDPEFINALKHTDNADPKYPTIKDAVMAARCANVKALTVMKKHGFTKWDNPEIMIAACKIPVLENVQTVHKYGGNVNASNKDGVTALMFAARSGEVEMVKYLVSRGADVKAKSNDGDTVLMFAAERGKVKMVKYLVSREADVKAKRNDGSTVLMCAAKAGKTETVKYLVSRGADINEKMPSGMTALMFAARSGNIETVKYLVNQDADVTAKDNDGKTALDHAKGECKDYLRSVAK